MSMVQQNLIGGDYRDGRVWVSFGISILAAILFWYQSCVHMSIKTSPSGPVSGIITSEYYPALAIRLVIALLWFGYNMSIYRKPDERYY